MPLQQGWRDIVMSVSVCLCPFVFICQRAYLQNYTVFVHVTCDRGSALLWRSCDMLCTFGFMDDIVFAHNGRRACRYRYRCSE